MAYRQKYYYTIMAQLINKWVKWCGQCIKESRIDNRFSRPPLKNPSESITGLKDAMQSDLVPDLPPSGGCKHIATVLDAFSRYLFPCLPTNQDAKAIVKVIINIMTKHSFLPTTIFSDK